MTPSGVAEFAGDTSRASTRRRRTGARIASRCSTSPGRLLPLPRTRRRARRLHPAARDRTRRAGRDRLRPQSSTSPIVVDLCAGSGAIALSIASEVPSATVHAVEIDDAAMTWLQRNAAGRRGPGAPGRCGGCPSRVDGTVDVVISNPPYIPLRLKAELETEVRDHDPGPALYGGVDGLDVISEVVRRAAGLLQKRRAARGRARRHARRIGAGAAARERGSGATSTTTTT